MITNKTDLSKFDNSGYQVKASLFKIGCWYFINSFVFNSYYFPFIGLKVILLRFFGANIGDGVIIKPKVNIKYPWLLEIGEKVWVGENVWIDNLCNVKISSNVCISQGAMLLTGNHNYKSSAFDLIVGEILLEEGVWLGAKSIVCPGVICKSHSILSVASVANRDLEPYAIYKGNPAVKIKTREIL